MVKTTCGYCNKRKDFVVIQTNIEKKKFVCLNCWNKAIQKPGVAK